MKWKWSSKDANGKILQWWNHEDGQNSLARIDKEATGRFYVRLSVWIPWGEYRISLGYRKTLIGAKKLAEHFYDALQLKEGESK